MAKRLDAVMDLSPKYFKKCKQEKPTIIKSQKTVCEGNPVNPADIRSAVERFV